MLRSTLAGASFGQVAYVPLTAIDGPRYLTSLSWERLFFRAGHGDCLTITRSSGCRTTSCCITSRRRTERTSGALRIEKGSAPRLLLTAAYSPSVVRE